VSESDLYPEIIGALSRGDTRLLRVNAGLAWQGTVVERTPRRLVLLEPRPVKIGVPGVSDLIGWTTVSAVAVFTAIECKSARGRLTPEQSAFLDVVRSMGGRAGVARSVDDARDIIAGVTQFTGLK
jgi:hypothetical protein